MDVFKIGSFSINVRILLYIQSNDAYISRLAADLLLVKGKTLIQKVENFADFIHSHSSLGTPIERIMRIVIVMWGGNVPGNKGHMAHHEKSIMKKVKWPQAIPIIY